MPAKPRASREGCRGQLGPHRVLAAGRAAWDLVESESPISLPLLSVQEEVSEGWLAGPVQLPWTRCGM